MLCRFIDWLFDMPISVDVEHQELLRDFGVLFLIPFALFLLSYVRVSSTFYRRWSAEDREIPLSAASSKPVPPPHAEIN
jgi:hypothetical protein